MRQLLYSLRFRLLLLVLMAAVPALALMLYSGLRQRELAATAAQQEALRLVRHASANHEQLISEARQLLVALARLPEVRQGDAAVCAALFTEISKQSPSFEYIGLAKLNGDVLTTAASLSANINVADRSYFQRTVRSRNFAVGDYQVDILSGKPSLNCGYPVFDGAGAMQSVLFVALDLDWFNRFAAEAQLPHGSAFAVIDRNGTVLARYPQPRQWVGKTLMDAPAVDLIRRTLAIQHEGTAEAIGLDSVKRLMAFRRLGGVPRGSDVYVAVGIPSDVAYAAANRLMVRNLIALGAVALLALAAAWVGGHLFVLRRVKPLVAAAKRLAAGDLTARAGLPHRHGEINQLGIAFDEMATALQNTEADRAKLLEKIQHEHRKTKDLQERLQLQIDRMPIGCITWDTEFRVQTWNPAAEKIFGFTAAEAAGKHPYDLIVPKEAQPHVDEIWRRLLAGDTTAHSVNNNTTKDGRTIVCDWSNTPLKAADGTVIGVLSMVQDITERKRAEEMLRRAHAELELRVQERTAELRKANEELMAEIAERKRMEEALRKERDKAQNYLDVAGVMLVLVNADQTVGLINKMGCMILGYEEREIVGKNWFHNFIPESVRSDVLGVFHKLMAGELKLTEHYENPVLTKNSGQRLIAWHNTLLRDEHGRIQGILSSGEDITERRQLEDSLAERTRELERSNRELEHFAYITSHDLQEPLRMVASYTQLFARRYKGNLDAEADEFIGYVVDGAKRMQRLINDLLEYSRVSTRGKPFEETSCEAALDRALANLKLALEETGAQVTRDPLPMVTGDPTQMMQLLQNLISNAIKFRKKDKPPRIHISAKRKDSDWVFAVRDNGIGIEPQYHERIFMIFQRLHAREDYPGTGIGLAICKRIVERHGGRIWVESQPGHGSTFYFTIPANAGGAP